MSDAHICIGYDSGKDQYIIEYSVGSPMGPYKTSYSISKMNASSNELDAIKKWELENPMTVDLFGMLPLPTSNGSSGAAISAWNDAASLNSMPLVPSPIFEREHQEQSTCPVVQQNLINCECGVDSAGGGNHSTWCPKI